LFDCDADRSDEISFRAGDIIYVLDVVSDEWFLGRLKKTAAEGLAPLAYVAYPEDEDLEIVFCPYVPSETEESISVTDSPLLTASPLSGDKSREDDSVIPLAEFAKKDSSGFERDEDGGDLSSIDGNEVIPSRMPPCSPAKAPRTAGPRQVEVVSTDRYRHITGANPLEGNPVKYLDALEDDAGACGRITASLFQCEKHTVTAAQSAVASDLLQALASHPGSCVVFSPYFS
tara:strand:- start:325 stop:1017 length:693 start_codon:yes stop_codon:yes gene_type:complete